MQRKRKAPQNEETFAEIDPAGCLQGDGVTIMALEEGAWGAMYPNHWAGV